MNCATTTPSGRAPASCWTYTDYRYISSSRHPIKTLNDIKGLKFRVPQSAVLLASYKARG
ncbi:MAG: hypothetical protein V8Q84_10850 [Bilophila sp.]